MAETTGPKTSRFDLIPFILERNEQSAPRSVLRDRHAIDLDVEGPGPLRHAEEDAGWGVFREVALVDFVEGLEPVRREAQHIALQHMLEFRPGGLQRLLHLLQDQLNLALERGVDEDLAGLRSEEHTSELQ